MSELPLSQDLNETDAQSYRILLIEDDPIASSVISLLLHRQGHIVTSTPRGADAARLFFLIDPQIVISDIILPDVDILETLSEFRRLRPELMIIATSGNPYLLKVAQQHGITRTLRKPLAPEELTAAIAAL